MPTIGDQLNRDVYSRGIAEVHSTLCELADKYERAARDMHVFNDGYSLVAYVCVQLDTQLRGMDFPNL